MKLALPLGLLLAGIGCKSDYSVVQGPVDVDPGDITDCEFTEIPGTQIRRYDCNPVFYSSGEDWAPQMGGVGFRVEEVLGHPFYQMWYVGYPESNNQPYGLGMAISPDGTNWEPNDTNPLLQAEAGWAEDYMDALQVVWDGDGQQYVAMYQGINMSGIGPTNRDETGLGMLTSPDGLNWSRYDGGEMMVDFTATNYCWPLGFAWLPSSGFNGYLAGGESRTSDKCQIYGFYGTSLSNIDLGQNPILEAGPETYDQMGMISVAVVEYTYPDDADKAGETELFMFYVGFSSWTNDPNGAWRYATNPTLNLAKSTDGGFTWTKDPNNPIPISHNNENYISYVAAQVVGHRIHLWVGDYYQEYDDSAIGYFLYDPTAETY